VGIKIPIFTGEDQSQFLDVGILYLPVESTFTRQEFELKFSFRILKELLDLNGGLDGGIVIVYRLPP